MGGLHEPEPSIRADAVQYYETGKITNTLLQTLSDRSKLDTPIICDNKQSLVIDLICRIDKTAEFIWLIRDVHSCIESFARRGEYNEYKETRRIDPNFSSDWDTNMKLYWLYFEKNACIARAFNRHNVVPTIMYTTDLKERENVSK